ncbi:hypothetical protein [Dehalococcoides mccartyi]|nr:hypothetical protein [Dehalococcoides mccartyi]
MTNYVLIITVKGSLSGLNFDIISAPAFKPISKGLLAGFYEYAVILSGK